MIISLRKPKTAVIGTSWPSTESSPSSWRWRMVRPSWSGVSGLGWSRPRRVPMPAARMTTCKGGGGVRSRVLLDGERPSRTLVRTRSEVRMVLISLMGRPCRCRCAGGEEQVEDAAGRAAVLQVGEGLPETGVVGRVLRADGIDVGDGGHQLLARAQQRGRRGLLQIEVEAAHLVPEGVQVVGEEQ